MSAQAMIGSTIAAATAGMMVNSFVFPDGHIVVWPAAGPQAFDACHQRPNRQLNSKG